MPNMAAIFKQEISRLSRREIRRQTQRLRRAAAQHRRDIARLKRDAAALHRRLALVDRQLGGAAVPAAAGVKAEKIRFTAKGLRSHRGRLGISAADYGQLVGVSGQTIYQWEQGGARPRKQQLPALAALRRVGKREASARLKTLGAKAPARAARKAPTRRAGGRKRRARTKR